MKIKHSKAVTSTSKSINTELKSNSWAWLTNELLEMILDNLDVEEDRSTILNMRMTHPHWNSVVSSVLERKRHRPLQKWAPFHDTSRMEDIYLEKYRPLYILKLEMARLTRDSNISIEIRRGICQKGVIGEEGDILFTNALYICPQAEERLTRARTTQHGPEVTSTIIKPLISFGNLTLLCLHGIQYTPQQLQQLLNEVPKLKTLEILNTIVLEDCHNFEAQWPLPELPELKTLLVRRNESSSYFKKTGMNFRISRWLTMPYASHQLTHLEVDYARYVDPWGNKNLEQLKIYGLASLPTENTKATSLIRLSILEVEGNKISFKDFASFIQQFSKKLVHFHLDVDPAAFKDVVMGVTGYHALTHEIITIKEAMLPELALENQSMFPNLKTFAFPFPFDVLKVYWRMVKYFLGMFPAIETLHLITTFDSETVFKNMSDSKADFEAIWSLCPKLKDMLLYEGRTECSFWNIFGGMEQLEDWMVGHSAEVEEAMFIEIPAIPVIQLD